MPKAVKLLRVEELYEEFGYYTEINIAKTYPGFAGKEKINSIVSLLREDFVEKTKLDVVRVEDFGNSLEKDIRTKEEKTIDLPKSNVLKFYLQDGSWVAVRPSGTEPKIKYYFSVSAKDKKSSEDKAERFKDEFLRIIEES